MVSKSHTTFTRLIGRANQGSFSEEFSCMLRYAIVWFSWDTPVWGQVWAPVWAPVWGQVSDARLWMNNVRYGGTAWHLKHCVQTSQCGRLQCGAPVWGPPVWFPSGIDHISESSTKMYDLDKSLQNSRLLQMFMVVIVLLYLVFDC